MTRFFFIALFILDLPINVYAGGIDETIDRAFAPAADLLSNIVFYKINFLGIDWSLVIVWLISGAIFFTFYLKFISIRGFVHAIKITMGKYSNPKATGEVSHFQALCTAVSGTVGIGNIGGIPIAIAMGGPGAVFWMMMAGFLGMSTKFVECTLSTKYRRENQDGTVSGGPMYFIQKGFLKRKMPRLGKAVGIFYAFGIVFGCLGGGCMFQSNQAYVQFVSITGNQASFFADKGWLFGLIFAAILFAVIIGGLKSIARVAEKLVPFMAIFYLFGALLLIILNYNYIAPAISTIITGAFRPESMYGGVVGVMMLGFQRAIFSNEAGLGTAAIAHSAVKTEEPITEGFVSLLEPFIDTVIIQAMTGLVVVSTMLAMPGLADSGLRGMEMTSAAFKFRFELAPYGISFAGLLFAFSTAIAWSYYGLKGWTYIVGEGLWKANTYNIIFCLFFVIGCMVDLDSVMKLSDAFMFIICVPNILGLYMMAPDVKEEVNQYLARLKSGRITETSVKIGSPVTNSVESNYQ